MNNEMFAPSLVTLTGASDDTKYEDLFERSKKYPFVEWAVLYSYSRSGNDPRYPSFDWIHNLVKTPEVQNGEVNIALHLCGAGKTDVVTEFVRGLNTIPWFYLGQSGLFMLPGNARIQLNFNLQNVHFSIADLQRIIAINNDFGGTPIITQHNEANKELLNHRFAPNHQILFDSSGGRGIEVAKWPAPIPEKMCGYAGGIGPDNIGDVSFALDPIAAPPFWIDMETKIRTDNKLDLELCDHVLKICEGWIEMNQGLSQSV
jgi:hypothetical protein